MSLMRDLFILLEVFMNWLPIRLIIAFSVFFIGLKNIWIALPFKYIDLDEQLLKHTLN